MDDATESSGEKSGEDVTLKKKYDLLEKNYRRLLEVTTSLTEALEHAVKGNFFELEKTINHCMKVYPELFSLQIRKPPSRANFRTAYNTSVSEENTDEGNEILNYEYYRKSEKSPKYLKSNSRDGRSSSDRSPKHSDAESQHKRDHSPGLSFVKLNDEKTIPPIFQQVEILKPGRVGGYPLNNDVNIMSLYPSAQNTKHINFNSDNESSSAISPITERDNPYLMLNSENAYIVKHPESDTDGSSKLRRKVKKYKADKSDSEKLVIEEASSNGPFEIVVQPQDRNKLNDPGFSIKIIPDSASTRRNVNTPNVKEIYNPNETCIIIKKNNDSRQLQKESMNNEIVLNSSNDQLSLSVTIANKLQSLSSGLQEHTEALKPVYQQKTATKTKQFYHSSDNHSCRIEESDQEESSRIALLNSYGTLNKPKIQDEAFEEIKDDYPSIKYNLIHGSVKQKSLILQSLRLNLIHTLAYERGILLNSYIENDVLNLETEPYLLDFLIPKEIINGWDLLLQQTIFKFLNTLSSMWKGRDYLCNHDKIIISMLKYFNEKFTMNVPSEAICKDMLIGTFHKLSTRVNPQAVLVNAGIAEKVLYSLLENRNTITPYRLRHTLGLLINICISKHGRKSMEPLSNDLLVLIATLMSSRDNKIISNAARLLYILMASEKFHKEANKMEIVKYVEEAMKITNKRTKLQLETLKSTITHSKPHVQLHNADAEEVYLQNIEPEIEELEEEVEIGEPGVIISQMELYKQYETENYHKINSVFSQEEEVKNKLKKNNIDVIDECDEQEEWVYSKDGKTKYRKSKRKSRVEGDDVSDMDTITVGTNQSDGGDGKNNGRQSADSKFSKDTKKSKWWLGKKRDSDTLSMLSSNYTLLKEALDNIIDDQSNYNIIPEIVEEGKEKEEENTKSITITQEKVSISSKTIEIKKDDTNVEIIEPPIKIEKSESGLQAEKPQPKISELITQKSRKHSIFSQDGKSTYDYEYCEETKQIQLQLQHNNIFSEMRESPLKGLLELSKASKPNTPLVSDIDSQIEDKTKNK